LKKSTPNFMIYGELGIYPMSVYIELRMINFWSKMAFNSMPSACFYW
jgi:hypothetical protein